MQTVYVLESEKDGNLYVGCTGDLESRIEYHNNGRVKSTKNRRPFKLIFSEEYPDCYEAYRMERFYKTAPGKKVLKEKIKHCQIV